jgi:hypothetical protein
MNYTDTIKNLEKTYLIATPLSGLMHGTGKDIMPKLLSEYNILNNMKKEGQDTSQSAKKLMMDMLGIYGFREEPAYFLNMCNGLEKDETIKEIQGYLNELISEDIDLRMAVKRLVYTPFSGAMFDSPEKLVPKISDELQIHYSNHLKDNDPQRYYFHTVDIMLDLLGVYEDLGKINSISNRYIPHELKKVLDYYQSSIN